jgi:class 3 adenylate cyclase
LNRERIAENKRREIENQSRLAAGLPPHPQFAVLFVGMGINTGTVTVGLMGAESKAVVRQGNYTVFGREVNLASRLESRASRGQILISEATFERLKFEDSALGAGCVALPPLSDLKGIRGSIQIYEVPWALPDAPSLDSLATSLRSEPAPSIPSRETIPASKPAVPL